MIGSHTISRSNETQRAILTSCLPCIGLTGSQPKRPVRRPPNRMFYCTPLSGSVICCD